MCLSPQKKLVLIISVHCSSNIFICSVYDCHLFYFKFHGFLNSMGCSLLAAKQFHKRISSVLRRIFMSLVSVKHCQNYMIPFPKAHFTHFKKSCIRKLGLFVSYLVSMEPQKVPFMIKANPPGFET